jgi:SNF2 family DNA or RNA helicase
VTPPSNLFLQATHDKKVAICSYEYASASSDSIAAIPWDLVIIDEAHRLRNVYRKTGNTRAKNIKQALGGRKKLLLTFVIRLGCYQSLYSGLKKSN